mmetsp:Transcript_19688/g.54960  ORF Transcript_19688/g.54960 Transcript_19688/m.54960 type:complete len:294 (+) Transcript_19688:69-950(+)|eukprot:CAMPEP_0202362222 /NCGR_PEP_ID=MMETSP1126-20121109/14475_1 /ASSEMBLY_ACC=CAM_ASM_000457 /TAXON_ID=3047 /ORGANISM="Dunaliella tertiolecta, Strain CCMP1320" /LENGTH=293 /DNA_ID=CAMNT_0048956339 /DNA_START=58 /DNA_END=939 /DNA_ORIENTATION=+
MQTLSACKPGALLSSSLPLQGPKPHVVGLGGHRRAQTRLPPPQALELASLCEQSFQIPAAAALVLPVMGLAGYKLSLYSQKEVINARMLGNFIPEGARNIIQMNGSTRDIFYYPKSTVQIAVYGNDLKSGLFEQAGMQAQIPTVSFKKPASSLDAVPSNSVDGIACLGGISESEPRVQKRVITEALRVLKTGAPFIFIEPLADGASPLRPLFSGNGSKAIATSTLEELLDVPGLDVLQVDVALDGSDPHAVGVATKSASRVVEGLSRAERRQLERQLGKRKDSPAAVEASETS